MTIQFSHQTTILQRLEGAAALGFAVIAYAQLGQSWLVFALLFFVPDLFMLGYLRSARFGATTYNLLHTYAAPAVLALLGLATGPLAFGLALIWLGHIGFDRMLGYGLKLPEGFEHTHLGPIGKARRGH
jgi:type IV secretory pathway VirB2 component (pilin)